MSLRLPHQVINEETCQLQKKHFDKVFGAYPYRTGISLPSRRCEKIDFPGGQAGILTKF
jgi:hypothetical protein